MQLILVVDVVHLGKRGDVVNVAAGYGRNFLVPKGFAIAATPGNLKMVEQQRVALAKKEATARDEAEILAGELSKIHLVISRKAGDTGALFGSVTTKDLADLLAGAGINLDRRKLELEHPLKALGNFRVNVHPHTEVQAEILVSVIAEEDEEVGRVLERGAESDEILKQTAARVEAIEAAQESERAAQEAALAANEEEAGEPAS